MSKREGTQFFLDLWRQYVHYKVLSEFAATATATTVAKAVAKDFIVAGRWQTRTNLIANTRYPRVMRGMRCMLV